MRPLARSEARPPSPAPPDRLLLTPGIEARPELNGTAPGD